MCIGIREERNGRKQTNTREPTLQRRKAKVEKGWM